MADIVPGVSDGAVEKHLPVYTVEGNKVYVVVGDVEHPMTEAHFIEWISLQTRQGNQRKCLLPGDMPAACFSICDGDEVEAVFAYCNLHSLWKNEVPAPAVCDLKPVNTDTEENYTVCKCNNVKYFDIINAVHDASDMPSLLALFESVRNTTHCSTGCGGCYNRVLHIISEVMSGKIS